MKALYKNAEYPCKAVFSSDYTRLLFEEKPDIEIVGEFNLAADNGFVLRTINTSDYLRTYWDDAMFVLTNAPEYPAPDPVELEDSDEGVTWDVMAEAIKEGVNGV